MGAEDVHRGVVIPGVAACFAGSEKGDFILLLFLRFRIVMSGGEKDFIGAGTEKGAGGFAEAWRDAVNVTGFKTEDIDLVKRISGFAHALKNQVFAIGREITFAGLSFESDRAGVLEELLLAGVKSRAEKGRRDEGRDFQIHEQTLALNFVLGQLCGGWVIYGIVGRRAGFVLLRPGTAALRTEFDFIKFEGLLALAKVSVAIGDFETVTRELGVLLVGSDLEEILQRS